jgi:hypothetical protein
MLLVTAWAVASCCLQQLSLHVQPCSARPSLVKCQASLTSLPTTGDELSQQRHQHRHAVKCLDKVPACDELPAAP